MRGVGGVVCVGGIGVAGGVYAGCVGGVCGVYVGCVEGVCEGAWSVSGVCRELGVYRV